MTEKFRIRTPKVATDWGDSGYVGRVASLSHRALQDIHEEEVNPNEPQHAAFTNLDNLMNAAAVRKNSSALDALSAGLPDVPADELIEKIRELREILGNLAVRQRLDEKQFKALEGFLSVLADHHMGNVAAEASGFSRNSRRRTN